MSMGLIAAAVALSRQIFTGVRGDLLCGLLPSCFAERVAEIHRRIHRFGSGQLIAESSAVSAVVRAIRLRWDDSDNVNKSQCIDDFESPAYSHRVAGRSHMQDCDHGDDDVKDK